MISTSIAYILDFRANTGALQPFIKLVRKYYKMFHISNVNAITSLVFPTLIIILKDKSEQLSTKIKILAPLYPDCVLCPTETNTLMKLGGNMETLKVFLIYLYYHDR
jgi:hypothetical protein